MQKKDSTINCVLSLLFNIIVYGALTYENSIFPDNNYAKAIWTFCGIYIWCMLMIAFYKPQNNKHCFNSNFLCILVIFEIGYAFYHLENGHEKWLVGHFDNPAGFSMFIVSCFPFFYNQAWGKQKKWIKHFIDFFFVIIILLTGSRTGIVAITVIIIFANLRKTVHLKIFKILTLTTILCTAIFLLYMIKKDSANGRILIWKCTYN